MRRLYNILFIFLFIIMIVFDSCQEPKDLTEPEIFSILNQIIKDDSLKFISVCPEFEKDQRTKSYLYEFSELDKIFINRQIKKFIGSKIKNGDLQNYSPHFKKYFNIKIDSICGEQTTAKLSFPLIGANRDKMIIEIFESGHGGVYLYLKRNDKWKRDKTIEYWIE